MDMENLKLRRRGLCFLAGIEETHFKTLRSRDQLPFIVESDDMGTWQRFSVRQAFLLRCHVEMTMDGGLPPDVAAKAVSNSIGHLARNIFETIAMPGQQDVFIGIEKWRAGDTVGAAHYAGTLIEIAIQSEARAERERVHGDERTRLVLVNASKAARFVLDRASEFGVVDDEKAGKGPLH